MNGKKSLNESRIERKKEDTKQKIIRTTIDLINRFGIEDTTMELIAKETDIAKGTLYNYFSLKEAIIDEYAKNLLRQKLTKQVNLIMKLSNTRSRMKKFFKEIIKIIQAQRSIFEKCFFYRLKIFNSFQKDKNSRSGLQFIIHEIISIGQQNKEIRDDLPLQIIEDLFGFSFIEIIKQLFLNPDNFNVDKSINICVDIFLNGVYPAKN